MRRRAQSLRGLLVWGVLLLLLMTTGLVAGCLYMLARLAQTTDWTTHSLAVQVALSQLRSDLYQMESEERGYWLSNNSEFVTDHEKLLKSIEDQANGLPQKVEDNRLQAGLADKLKDELRNRVNMSRHLISMQREGKRDEVREMVLRREPHLLLQASLDDIGSMETAEQQLLARRSESMQSFQGILTWMLATGLLLCLGTGVTILYRLSRRLEPLADCAAMADKIGKGDLSLQPLPIRVEDEVGLLTRRLNQMLENLRLLTVQNRGAADKLGTATRTILSAARDQAVYVQQQAAAVQETSATMEELGQSANHISERARDVVARAEATSKASEMGLQAVEENVRSTASTLEQVRVVASKILSLSEKTQAIGDIVSTVNDLSERSNVLALNAAILAAASQEGKTFSVVANEMKSLAEQSKDATTQVRGLLGDIERGIQACVFLTEEAVKRGEAGSVYTDQVNATIQNLAGNIQDSLQAFQQIVAATEQQRTASDHVNAALWSIRQASDQTAMGTQKFESSARELHELSQALVATMERYRLRHETS